MKEIEEEVWTAAKFIRSNGTILDFTGLYEVSDLGRVRSLNYSNTGNIKIMSPCAVKCIDETMWYQEILCLDKKRYTLPVHRLVLSSFKENEYFPGAVCDHIVARSETSCDNSLSNLHWVSAQQNRNTEHCNVLLTEALTNHLVLSKRVRVTDLTTRESTEFPSAREAGRSLGINPKLPAAYISKCNGYCKKRNLHFAYV